MRKGGGKNKGSSFERDICRQLSKWWMEDEERDDIFWLTAGSGARATTRIKKNKKTANSYGDITFIDEEGKKLIDLCLFELKRGYTKELDLLCLIDKDFSKSKLFSFWQEAEQERRDADRPFAVLIFKRNRSESCILISKIFFNILIDQAGLFKNCLCEINIKEYDIMVMRLNDFLQWVHREDFIGL